MSLRSRITDKLNEHLPITLGALFYLFALANDYISSAFVGYTHTGFESNGFMRDAHANFLLSHALVVDSSVALTYILASIVIYQALKNIPAVGPSLANGAIALFFGWRGFERLMDAVLQNYWIGLKLYQDLPDFLK